MTSELRIERLEVMNFRNIEQLELELAPRINVIAGDNGHGKTSVLEALYFVATSRSFRTERISEAQREGAATTRVTALVLDAGQQRAQRAALVSGRRSLALDGKRPESLASFAVRTPVVVFHPGDLQLVSGGAALRRTLLDRIGLFQEPHRAQARSRYAKAQRQRQQLLQQRGVRARELEVFEDLMAQAGVEVELGRAMSTVALRSALQEVFAELAAADLELTLELRMGGCTDAAEFRRELFARRERDLQRRAASFGPQRDDLELTLNRRSARHHASQGQQRILTLALKVAELDCVRRARGADPLLLLDDVSSELDPERTGAVYRFVRRATNQVLVTTTRPELFETPGLGAVDRADFRLHHGQLVRL